MKWFAWPAALICFGMGCTSHVPEREDVERSRVIYVATHGNDSWSGLKQKPDRLKADGPMATLPAALERVRAARGQAAAAGTETWTILLEGGTYFLREPLVIRPEDSGLRIGDGGRAPAAN